MTVTSLALGRPPHHGGRRRALDRGQLHGRGDGVLAPLADPHLTLLLTAAGALCNDASLRAALDGLHLLGDPTEAALLVAAGKAGLDPAELARAWPRRREIPFDPARRMMATFHVMPARRRGPDAGAPGQGRPRRDPRARERASTRRTGRSRSPRRTARACSRRTAPWPPRACACSRSPGARSTRSRTAPWTISRSSASSGSSIRCGPASRTPSRPAARPASARSCSTGDQQLTAETVGRQLGLEPEAIRSRVSPEGKLDAGRGAAGAAARSSP